MNFAAVFGASLRSGYALPTCHPENSTPQRQPAEAPLIQSRNPSRQSRPALIRTADPFKVGSSITAIVGGSGARIGHGIDLISVNGGPRINVVGATNSGVYWFRN